MPLQPDGPALDLTVEVTAADGAQRRWGPGARAGDIPQGLAIRTKQAEGFADASLSLSRRIDREYVDLHLFDDVVISGGADIAYEGRIAALPRSMQDTHSISVQAAGWMAHARDRKLSEIIVDRDLGAWQDIGRARQAALLTAGWTFGSFGVQPDATGLPALRGQIALDGAKQITEPLYDAGPGNRIAQVYYDWAGGNVAAQTVDANWAVVLFGCDDDATNGSVAGQTLNATATSGTGFYTPAAAKRYIGLQFAYGTAFTSTTDYLAWLRNSAMYGDHGLPLIGDSNPKGVAASDVIRYLAAKYCPKLNTAGVQPTTYPIPHVVFRDRVDPYDAFLEVNKYHLWQLAVWEKRTLTYGPIDMSDYDWEVRLSDAGTRVDLQGDSASTIANGVVVAYQDVATGAANVVTPDDHPELRDPSDSNPATRAGLTVWTELPLSAPSHTSGALQVGRASLAEFNQPRAPGTISVQGHIRDRAGHWQPVWKVRAGDRIVIADHPNDRPRLVVETDYQHDPKTISIAVDSTFKRVDAVLDRFGTALKANNLL